MAKRRAVFLDRDGVVIEEVHYLSDPRRLRLIPGAPGAISALRAAGLRVVVISNQSGVGRGYLTLGTLARIHDKLARRLRDHGTRLDALYFCPHAPEDRCACRKPKLALLRKAARRFSLDLSASYFVGDTTTDLKTARDAGCKALLVRTGHGGRDGNYRVRPDGEFRDLEAAARWILRDAVSGGRTRARPRTPGPAARRSAPGTAAARRSR